VTGELLTAGSGELELLGLGSATLTEGTTTPFGGFHSTTYGRWEPAPWLEESISGDSPTAWGVHETGSADGKTRIEGENVTVAGIELALAFRPGGATLSAIFAGKTRLFTAGQEQA
jgi:hypothetical protein